MRFTLLLIVLAVSIYSFDLEEYMDDERRDPEVLFKDYSDDYNTDQKTSTIQNFMFYTPWNRDGKQLALKYAKKLDYVSPCWYQVNLKDNHIVFQHEVNYDLALIKQLKAKNPNLKVIPRVYIPGDRVVVLQRVGSNRQAMQELMTLTEKVVNLEGIDGLCWDTPFNSFSAEGNSKQLNELIRMIINGMKEKMKGKLLFVNTNRPNQVDMTLIKSLHFDGLLIQCYSGKRDPHQLAFVKNFIKKLNMKDRKFVLVLPFFSTKSNGQMISTKDAIKMMEERGLRRAWFDTICLFEVTQNLNIQVPCYNYFKESFEAIGQDNHMVGFWQGGNGLQIYYSFL